MATRVLPDANVLFSRTQRDWLFLLKLESEGAIFTIATTVDILAETIARIRDRYPSLDGQATTRIHDRITEATDERIERYVIDGTWPGSDAGDAHVHAAATYGTVNLVLTCDLGWEKLTDAERDALSYEAHHPDSFFCLVDETNSEVVRAVISNQMAYWFARQGEVDLPARLRDAGCPLFAERVRKHLMTMNCSELTK